MTYECFDVTIEDQIANVVMNRPDKRNSMIPAFWDEFQDIVRDIDDHSRARVIVLSSTGPHFSAGLDISAFNMTAPSDADEAKRKRLQHAADFHQNVRYMQDTFTCLEQCRIPVIAAIQGGAIGGGVDLATACDIRYATKDAFVTIFEIELGLAADVGTFPRIYHLIPDGIARELAYTGRRMPADEAAKWGLFNRVFADQQTMLAEAHELARDIASKPPTAVYGCKRMANYARDHSTADTLDYVALWNASHLQSEEIMEAMTARMQKRSGDFVELPHKTRRLTDRDSVI